MPYYRSPVALAAGTTMGATYLNTDLDLRARFNLKPLHEELLRAGLDGLFPDPSHNVWWSSYNAPRHRHPTEAIRLILDVVEGLTPEGRRKWDACASRRFNVGYECDEDPSSSVWQVTPKVLRRMVEAQVAFVVTIYRRSENIDAAFGSNTATPTRESAAPK